MIYCVKLSCLLWCLNSRKWWKIQGVDSTRVSGLCWVLHFKLSSAGSVWVLTLLMATWQERVSVIQLCLQVLHCCRCHHHSFCCIFFHKVLRGIHKFFGFFFFLGQSSGVGNLLLFRKDDMETYSPTGRTFYMSADTDSVLSSTEQPINGHCSGWNISYQPCRNHPLPRDLHLKTWVSLTTCKDISSVADIWYYLNA